MNQSDVCGRLNSRKCTLNLVLVFHSGMIRFVFEMAAIHLMPWSFKKYEAAAYKNLKQ